MKCFGLRFLLSPLALLCALGQQTGWDKAAALPAGTKVELLLVKDKTLTGTLNQVSPEGLTLTLKRDALQVARSDIRRLWVLGKGSRLKNAGIGALVGFGIFCPIGWASAGYIADMNNPPLNTRAAGCAALGGFGAGVAAGITAAVPATRRTLIYRAP